MSNVEEHAHEQKAGDEMARNAVHSLETSIFELLTSNTLLCPSCHLRLSTDRMKSKPAFDALRKVQQAQQNLEEKSKHD